MSRMIPTLTGSITADQLGVVYIHEHVLTNPPESRMKLDPDYKLDDSDKIVEELQIFHSLGGNTLVDCTALDYGRDARAMLEVAKRTPVNLLAITGFNRGDYEEWVASGAVSQFAGMMMKDIEEGMDGTTAKAALIKIGTCYNNILPAEYRIIEAAGIAHQKTGTPVITHTTLGTMGVEQVKALEKAGVNPNRIALSHLDQNLDFYYLNQIAKTGAYIQFDGPSKVKYAPDSARIEMLKRLCDAGHEDRILISGDMGRQSYLTAYGGGPGFGFILGKFVPRLLAEGFPQELVDKFFKINPARFLSAAD
ncbi:MAG: phosphotriesterase-related protein [Firmicutes bacterium]|nr:phosphotriesterase-related protein [Bacillota bacterium]